MIVIVVLVFSFSYVSPIEDDAGNKYFTNITTFKDLFLDLIDYDKTYVNLELQQNSMIEGLKNAKSNISLTLHGRFEYVDTIYFDARYENDLVDMIDAYICIFLIDIGRECRILLTKVENDTLDTNYREDVTITPNNKWYCIRANTAMRSIITRPGFVLRISSCDARVVDSFKTPFLEYYVNRFTSYGYVNKNKHVPKKIRLYKPGTAPNSEAWYRSRPRSKRTAKHVRTTCNMYNTYINFASLGLPWIVTPRGFNFVYCSGICTLGVYEENAVLYSVLASIYIPHVKLSHCCVPKHMKDLVITYMVGRQQVVSIMRSVIVSSCTCV